MTTIYLFTALIGGTVLVCQFVLTLIGLGDTGFDLADDVPDSADVDLAEAGDFEGGGDDASHGSTWLFGVISFRTLVAAFTFFGAYERLRQTVDRGLRLTFADLSERSTALARGLAALGIVPGDR